MKNKTKLKKMQNKGEKTFLTHSKAQPIDSQEVYQSNFESEVADSGRSMVEMLGVLAVVGVLSVGGILGYKYAMTKYQANQIVNELNLTSSQMAIMLMRPHSADFELSLGEPYDDGHIATNALAFNFGCGAGGAEENANCASDDIEYFSEVQGVSESVCQNLVQLVQNLPYLEEVLVNNVIDTTGASCADNSTVRCLFNADRNALIDDNPEVTETETEADDGLECNGHGELLDGNTCYCISDWYDSESGLQTGGSNCELSGTEANQKFCNGTGYWMGYNNACSCLIGLYNASDGSVSVPKGSSCTLTQAEADTKFCNDKGAWKYYSYGSCQCSNDVSDSSNNNCQDNGGCCNYSEECGEHGVALSNGKCNCAWGWYDSETGLREGGHNCDLSQVEANKKFCNNTKWDGSNGTCSCPTGLYNASDGTSSVPKDSSCTLTQAEANKKFCNDNGTWQYSYSRGSCTCNNGMTDRSNNDCRDNGGCCQSLCTSNSNCGSEEYCKADAYSCSQEFNVSKTSGICYKATGTTQTISGLGSVTKSNDPMTWWSAQRYCQALGKQMVSLSDLGCSGTEYTACQDSQIVKILRTAFDDSYNIWTSNQKGDNCQAYRLALYNYGDSYNGRVGTDNRNSGYSYYALCK